MKSSESSSAQSGKSPFQHGPLTFDRDPNPSYLEKIGIGRQIWELCEILNTDAFDDFPKIRHILFRPFRPGGLLKFLSQIVLGYELLVRLRQERETRPYINIIGPRILTNLIISDRVMKNMNIRFMDGEGSEMHYSESAALIEIAPLKRERQTKGLLEFASLIRWPYERQLRDCLNAELDFREWAQRYPAVCDWWFGITLTGKQFRVRIMRCLMEAAASTRSIPPATNFMQGLVLSDRTYWPTGTAMGAVLGGMENVRTVCGWIGPCPKVENRDIQGWVFVENSPLKVPEVLGDRLEGLPDVVENVMEALRDVKEWIVPQVNIGPTDETNISLKPIELASLPCGTLVTAVGNEIFVSERSVPSYRATLNFIVNTSPQLYTPHWVPQFVAAPRCDGTHLLFKTTAMYYLKNVITSENLYEMRDQPKFLVINALNEGGELLARAWCSDRGRHAVIRRGPGCCFACAAKLAGGNGLGFDVLIWSADRRKA